MKRLIPPLPLFAAVLLAGIAPLRSEPQTITFAVPEADGTISLGVYNAEKKLVRTLAVNATEKDFQIGLNGLITTWDGKNDAGEALPAGKYDVKGYVVSEKVQSEGEAFHFNDWITDEDSPRLANPYAQSAEDKLITIAGNARLGGYPLPNEEPDWRVSALFNESGEWVKEVNGRSESLKFFQVLQIPPGNPSLPKFLSARGDRIVTSDGTSVWAHYARGESPKEPLKIQGLRLTSLSLGVGDTFWVVGQLAAEGDAGPTFVRQYSFTGEVLRQMKVDSPNTDITADTTENRIYLTHVEGPVTIIKGLRPIEVATEATTPAATATPTPAASESDAPKTADWEVFLEKTSTLCPKFGLVDGKLVPDAGETKQEDGARLDLPPSTMDQKQHTLVVHAKAAKDGEIWLTGSGGLRLALVGKLPGANRVVVAKGDGPGKLKVYVGNGVVVAEYLVSGLDEIAQFNAGEIDLP